MVLLYLIGVSLLVLSVIIRELRGIRASVSGSPVRSIGSYARSAWNWSLAVVFLCLCVGGFYAGAYWLWKQDHELLWGVLELIGGLAHLRCRRLDQGLDRILEQG
jgi:hypothetical protein